MATKLGLLHLDVMIGDAMSLKDKRRVVKGFKDRIARSRNVSVAEVDHLNNHRRSVLAVAMVGNDGRYVEGALQQVANAASENRAWVLLEYEIEMI
ncbi:hypothetical protein LCGC14_1998470 [marine sediment metagenome]|uniref:DUF503 domain-containing protein n=1 Tax=marine sediment metagenome TaxID=412755 RepID=A0A0F9FRQ5_9ZZZZ